MDRKDFFKTIVLGGGGLLALSSCRNNFLDTTPYGSISSGNMWETDGLTNLGVNGVYNALRQGGVCGNELYEYDRYGYTGQSRDRYALDTGTVTPGSGIFLSNWKNLYEGIQRANNAITNIAKKSPSPKKEKARYTAECKFLRAYFYFSLNRLYKGVPLYLEPVENSKATKGRSTEDDVWKAVINDLTDCINEPNLPLRYHKGDGNYGRATKGAAYALRGKTYLYWEKWSKAIDDFKEVKKAGYSLFPNYEALFKTANEECNEMIFTVQNIAKPGYGSDTQWFCGARSAHGSGWNSFLVSPHLADLYENIDGSKFNWDDIIQGYNSMPPAKREVFFYRDHLTNHQIQAAQNKGLDMSLYKPNSNVARIKQAYQNRDPRLKQNIITPYSTFLGDLGGKNHLVTSRWPYEQETPPVNDLRTDTQARFYYLYRKFVYEGVNTTPARNYCPTDFPLIRYADVLLMWAEAINKQGFNPKAVDLVNKVRKRAGVALLNSSPDTTVSGQEEMRKRIRHERRAEFPNEGINFFDEMRWKTWKKKVFENNGGTKQIWGSNVIDYVWKGDYIYTWPIPLDAIERNSNLEQNPGWTG